MSAPVRPVPARACSPARRRVLGGLAALALGARLAPAAAVRAAPFVPVAPGIRMRRGVDAEAAPGNDNAIANIGWIEGRSAVAVFDPGGSLADGLALRAAIRGATSLPIRYVICSHVHPDHIFGAGAFEGDHPEFIGHARLPEALAARADYYSRRLEAVLGAGSARPVSPTRLVEDRLELDLGGRMLELQAHAAAHSECDLSVYDRTTATLLPADLLFVTRVPSLDGSLRGWLAELERLQQLPARRAVPGHGPVRVDWPRGARDLQRYLRALLDGTRAALAGGLDLQQATAQVARGERARWQLFDAYHGHNITRAYKELEWE